MAPTPKASLRTESTRGSTHAHLMTSVQTNCFWLLPFKSLRLCYLVKRKKNESLFLKVPSQSQSLCANTPYACPCEPQCFSWVWVTAQAYQLQFETPLKDEPNGQSQRLSSVWSENHFTLPSLTFYTSLTM